MERSGEVIMCSSPHQFHPQFLDTPQENWWRSHESEEESSSTNDNEDAWERFLKEIDTKGHEIIHKLVSKVENNVQFEQMLREKSHHFRGEFASHMLGKIARKMGGERNGGGFVRRERGLGDDVLVRNERFKVKNVNGVGSIVKEEGRR
ncbi:hypothetical protein SASPL_124767 [Salvia splendens]|uniref:Uncharacterized protein n=1 Tax=Salvia splendens TaxID=180675 RepID=A0A8X8XH98_SALSN|nr:hypothetical protein SASPL_124767 [Salvia splendens]